MERSARLALGSAALLVVATLTALPAFANDSCLETKVAEVFVSPDGAVQGPGLVKICPHWTISPSLRLSRIYFNGRALGVWMLHSGEGGRFSDREYAVTLRRLPEGKIALADYYWPGADGRPKAPGLRAAQLEETRDAAVTMPAARTLQP
jgi:hypothetical protein